MNKYYEAPSDEAFEDMKEASIEIWNNYDDPSYRTEKIDRIKDIGNIQDNFMYMLAMFDSINQRKVIQLLKPETKEAVRERLEAGGANVLEIIRLGLFKQEI